jgi:hypothetical protein
VLGQHLEAGFAVVSLKHGVVFPQKGRAYEFSDGGIVVNDQYVHARCGLFAEMTSLIAAPSSLR